MKGGPEVTERPPHRVYVSTYVSVTARDWIDSLAEQYRVPRSVVIRHALQIAKQYEGNLEQRLDRYVEE